MHCFQITLVPILHTVFYFGGGKLIYNKWTFLNCHHGTARPQVTDGGTASNMVSSVPGICTGLFISPAGIYELDCETTKTDTAERSISRGREPQQVFLY